MRINSPKQTQASRENGAKSKGAKFPEGKNRVRLNALKDGLFSKEIVIASAGEQQEDFERLKKEMWDFFQPASALEEMLVVDIVENWWRRQRVRRAESAELKSRLDGLAIRDKFLRSDEVDSLKVRFFDLLRNYVAAIGAPPSQYPNAIAEKLEEVRRQLVGTSLGVEFLIKLMKGVESEAREEGQLSLDGEAMTSACCGFGDEIGRTCLKLNSMIIKEVRERPGSSAPNPDPESQDEVARIALRLRAIVDQNKKEAATEQQKSQSDQDDGSSAEQSRAQVKKTGPKATEEEGSTFDRNTSTKMLLAIIKEAISWLEIRKRTLKYAEEFETETRRAASIFPAEAPDRFLRAETTIERRMYRALVMLLALRPESDVPRMLR